MTTFPVLTVKEFMEYNTRVKILTLGIHENKTTMNKNWQKGLIHLKEMQIASSILIVQ